MSVLSYLQEVVTGVQITDWERIPIDTSIDTSQQKLAIAFL